MAWTLRDDTRSTMISEKDVESVQQDLVREMREEILKRRSLKSIAKDVVDGIKRASETKFFQRDGTVTDSRTVVAWEVRRKYIELAARLMHVLGPEVKSDFSVGLNLGLDEDGKMDLDMALEDLRLEIKSKPNKHSKNGTKRKKKKNGKEEQDIIDIEPATTDGANLPARKNISKDEVKRILRELNKKEKRTAAKKSASRKDTSQKNKRRKHMKMKPNAGKK